MINTRKPLAALAAEDLMSREVTTVCQDMPLREAARLLLHEQISGAPVVDSDGRCVGVLSATDFVRWTESQTDAESFPDPGWPARPGQSGSARAGLRARGECYWSDWQVINLDLLPDDAVRWYMTPDPVTATPATSIVKLAQRMTDAHIHRIIVVGKDWHPIGIVSSTDIVGAVANSATDTCSK